MSSPEQSHFTDAARLTAAIDDKFTVGAAQRGGIVRKHEESLALIPTSTLNQCPTASRVYLERPIPEEADEALAKWSTFGGHRVTVFENGGRIQTDFLASGVEVLKRQIISYPGDDEPLRGETQDEQLFRRAEELLGDTLSLTALSGIERAAAVRKSNVGEPIQQAEVDELLGWINTAIPEQQ